MRHLSYLASLATLLALVACGENGEGGAAPAPTCSGEDVLCGRSCVDTQSDPRHCGGCDVACPAGVGCVDGACTGCPEGWERCGDGCVDVRTAAAHCGACGSACAPGEACVDGACTVVCPQGQIACDGACHDLATSPAHCGSCGNACAAGEVCAGGACAIACPEGQAACDGGCHHLATSDEHCGACGAACGAGSVCVDGSCVITRCPAGETICDGACADLQRDPVHCGACGAACAAGELCVDGACALACAPGMEICDGACRNPATDRAHCGGCGNACATGEACVDGACVPSCGPFASTVCDGACTNTDLDPAHCGGCGNACAAGEVCVGGACALGCPASYGTCGGRCVDLHRDPANCGGCGNVCPEPPNGIPICVDGSCAAICGPGFSDCNGDLGTSGGDGCETDLTSSALNCGACGNACPILPGASSSCLFGDCIFECVADRGDCNLLDADGCEASLRTTTNCGTCGHQCPVGSICNDGICEPPGPGADCSTAIPLTLGVNSVSWSSSQATYLISPPGCISTAGAPVGPDIVLRWDATTSGEVHFEFDLPASALWSAVLVRDACGAIDTPLTCAGLTIPFIGTPVTGITFNALAGSSYFLHLVATNTQGPLPSPLQVTVTQQSAACMPGVGGMVGDGQTRIFTGVLGSFVEYYLSTDAAPDGWVYFGNAQATYRVPKTGGLAEDIKPALGTLPAVEEILVDGPNVYAFSETVGTSGVLHRISADGGATFSITDAVTFPTTPTSGFRGGAVHGGRIYLISREGLSTGATQIWSFPAAGPLPATATLEHSFTGYSGCAGIAVDDANFYVACQQGSLGADVTILRIDRTTHAIHSYLVIPATGFFVTTKMNLAVFASDRTGDGIADFLYFMDDVPSVGVICDPAGANPTWSRPYFFGTGNGNYGLGFDPVANALWVFNDDTNQLIRFQ